MKFSRYQPFIYLLILLPIILGLSKNISLSNFEKSAQKNKGLKDHFSKMIYMEGGEFHKKLANTFVPSELDSTLFSQSMPERTFVGSYYISATEITNSDWRAFYEEKVQELGKIKAKEKFYPDTALWLNEFKYTSNRPHAKNYFSHPNFNDFPVVGITWDQANLFCKWKTEKVNKLLKRKGKNSLVEFRLPTENEWEFAAMKKQNGDKFERISYYSWTEDKMLQHLNDLVNIGQIFDQNGVPLKGYSDDGCLYPCEVASYAPNDHGIYDMSGNVSEWTADQAQIKTSFFANYESKTLSTLSEIENEIAFMKNNFDIKKAQVKSLIKKMEHDKKILTEKNVKICKGGSWASGLIYTQPGTRQGINKNKASVKIGFRVAISDVKEDLINYFPNKKWAPSGK